MRLKWTEKSIADLISIREDIIQDDRPLAAKKVVERIINHFEILVDQTGIGRPGRVSGTRELIITNTPYIVPYRVINDEIQILRVLHGAMLWPKNF